MKRYEKMSKEDIMDAYNNSICCGSCPLSENCDTTEDCVTNITTWLNQEIELVPRISKINTVEELDKAYQEYVDSPEMELFYAWLKREVVK